MHAIPCLKSWWPGRHGWVGGYPDVQKASFQIDPKIGVAWRFVSSQCPGPQMRQF